MAYKKIVHGFVEQTFDDSGRCIEQEFSPLDNAPIERRFILPEGLKESDLEEGEMGDDELIEDPELLAEVEAQEKFFGFDMIQPKAARRATVRK